MSKEWTKCKWCGSESHQVPVNNLEIMSQTCIAMNLATIANHLTRGNK